jgi:hypothetical protein
MTLLVATAGQGMAAESIGEPPAVLRPSVAGSFYPANPETLRNALDTYIKSADPPRIEGEIVAAIVPHAGYIYSGPVAAYAYKAIRDQEKKRGAEARKLDAVVVLGFSHRGRYPKVSVYYAGAVETPLGLAPVNEAIGAELMESGERLSFDRAVFAGEHSLEVQAPFIQAILPDIPLVPVIFGRQGAANIEAVGKGLEKIARDKRIMVVATTDLSHYRPYAGANSLDGETIDVILKGSAKDMARYVDERRDSMCGPAPVLAALAFAESQGAKPVLLKYANSGDTAGRKDAVVGYAAIVFVKKQSSDGAKAHEAENESDAAGEEYLSEHDKAALLDLARKSVESIVRKKRLPSIEKPAGDKLRANGAAFVTLHKNGKLRGCIGRMDAATPLYETVVRMAAAAAVQDPRFRPVSADELKDICIEISVNTPLRQVSGADEIVMGKHGVVVSNGMRRGVFLPQVATETGWSKEEFLENLCAQKAGLPRDAYKNGAKLSVFESIVFEEER